MDKINQILKDPTYTQILKDSFGGIVYESGTQQKYNASKILKLWSEATQAEKEAAGGVMKGVFSFLTEQQ